MTNTATNSTTVAALEFDDITVGYGPAGSRRPLVTDLTARVEPGQTLALRGRSGSGKTTILNTALGLHEPWAGRIRWNGTDIAHLSADQRADQRLARMGIVLQDGGLLAGLTALENVLIPVLKHRSRKADRDKARTALDLVGLADREDHTPDRLSGGEAQRVAIARALYADPPLLIVDEPTASLDRAAADDIIALLSTLTQTHGRALLIASHDPHAIAIGTTVIDVDVDDENRRPDRTRPEVGSTARV